MMGHIRLVYRTTFVIIVAVSGIVLTPLVQNGFMYRRGHSLRITSIWHGLLARALGIRITQHRLRHTMATELAAKKDIRTLQHLLGHTNVSTTMQYVHPDMDRMRSLLEDISL